MNDKPLKVLSASAGSGKTYNLVFNYLLLLLTSDRKMPFAHIAAMTFTNKAALEMKTRIIEALEILAYPELYHKDERKMENALLETLQIEESELHDKCRLILFDLLHRYEEFMVLTIDKFNLRLIRTFSKELDLPPEFDVVINEDEELEIVLDGLLQELGQPEKVQLTKLAVQFAQSKLFEGEKWDFKKSVTDLSKELLKESNKSIFEKLPLIHFTSKSYKDIKERVLALENRMEKRCSEMLESLLGQGVEEDVMSNRIAYGKDFLKAIQNAKAKILKEEYIITQGRLDALRDGNKSSEGFPHYASEVESCVQDVLLINQEYIKVHEIRKNYYNMAFLQLIQNRLEVHRKNEKTILISEFNSLLSQLVRDEEAPFIYEKLGTRLDHFLLDEFQDTSRMQWLNLIPLVDESIANGRTCFIVGDPKQSIYRWKNGLPEQFNALPAIYNPENNPTINQRSKRFVESSPGKQNLGHNWRSAKAIVEFNNTIFKSIYDKHDNENNAYSFYKDVEQKLVSDKVGFVEVEFQGKDSKSEAEIDQTLKSWIDRAVEDGYKMNEIVILGRDNKTCNAWAKQLTQMSYQVISSESLMVDSDGVVKWIISFLKKRKSPGSKSTTANFISQCMHHMGIDEIHFNSIEKKPGYLQKEEEFIKSLFKGEDSIYFVYDSLYSCISGFCELIDVDPLKNHYVNHLLDMAFQFDLNFGPDLDLFVKLYDEKGKRSPVQIPESEDTMQIMTIHKSKGLEFPVVLLPECKMNPKESPLIDELDDFIVKLSASTAKKLPETAERAIAQENTTLSDELNNLYVAFTRASERMQISYKGEYDSDVMINALYDFFDVKPEGKKSKKAKEEESEEANKIYSVGQAKRSGETKSKAARELFEPRSLNGFLWFPDIALRDDQKLDETDEISEARRYGTQLHLALSIIEKKENINTTLEELLLESKIEKEFKGRLNADCEALFDQVLTNLYASTFQVWNEQEIYEPESQESFRPDKIIENDAGEILVLDFKSGVSRKNDILQVQQYKKVVAKLFNKPTKAALLYTDRLELEWVD